MMNRDKMIKEAVKRMNIIGIIPQTIKEFEEKGIINKSTYGGILFWLDEEEKKIVEQFEKEHNCLVYHAIKCSYRMGGTGDIMKCFDLLYVSKDEEEWELDKADMKDNYMYVYSITNFCEEFGGITYKSLNGGVARTA